MNPTLISSPEPLIPGGLRIIALGGVSEIGRNMTVFEYLGKLLILDCGIRFPKQDEPGVDLILPDLSYFETKLVDIEALVLTHAHEDHIGAVPFLLKLRSDIPVVGSKFTIAIVRQRCRTHRIKPLCIEVAERQSSKHGVFKCEYFAVNHSIPGCLAVAIHTGAGTVLHTGDIKLDQQPIDGRPTDLPGMSRLGDAGVDLMLCDSTNSENLGVGSSESEIGPNLRRLMCSAEGRIIVACFASNVDRVQQIVNTAILLGKKVSYLGRSMIKNMSIAKQLGYLKVDDKYIVDINVAELMPLNKVVLITTGTQGEYMAALARMSRGEHRNISLKAGDLVILSSSLIPGNEEAVYKVIDALSKIGVKVITNNKAHVHTSGHAYAGEILFLYNGIRPHNVMPIHGNWRHLRANALLAEHAGIPKENIFIAENGTSVDLIDGEVNISGTLNIKKMYVNGLIAGDLNSATLEKRKNLSSGFIIVTIIFCRNTRKLAFPVHLYSYGFSEDFKALKSISHYVKIELEDLSLDDSKDISKITKVVNYTVEKWTEKIYHRQPVIVPTILEI